MAKKKKKKHEKIISREKYFEVIFMCGNGLLGILENSEGSLNHLHGNWDESISLTTHKLTAICSYYDSQ